MPSELIDAYEDPRERKWVIQEVKFASYPAAAEWEKIKDKPDVKKALERARKKLAKGCDVEESEYTLRVEIRYCPEVTNSWFMIRARPWASPQDAPIQPLPVAQPLLIPEAQL